MHNVAYHRIERIAGSVITLRDKLVRNIPCPRDPH